VESFEALPREKEEENHMSLFVYVNLGGLDKVLGFQGSGFRLGFRVQGSGFRKPWRP
jgi:hypothetical protein